MSWTFISTGGHLVGTLVRPSPLYSGGSPSFPFIHESEQARMRIHGKRCLRSKAVQSLMRLGEMKKTVTDTSLIKSETVVCASPGTSF